MNHGDTGAELRNLQLETHVLQLFIDYAPAAIAMFDHNMRYMAASRRFLFDYRLENQIVIGRSHYEIFPDIPQRWKEIHQRCLKGAVEKNEEEPFPRENGDIEWVRWEIHPWHQPSGEIGGIILFSEVITERKRAEQELQTVLLNLAGAEKQAGLGSWYFDVTTGKGWWSPQMYEIFGYDPEKGFPNTEEYLQLIHPQDRDLILSTLEQMGQGKLPPKIEFRTNPASREMRILSPQYRIEKDAAGNIVKFFGTVLDVTEQKRAEEDLQNTLTELKRSNAELEQFAFVASHDLQEPLRAMTGMVQLLQQRYKGRLDEDADEYIKHAVEASTRMQALINDLLMYSRVGRRQKPVELVNAEICLQIALNNLTTSIKESQAIITWDDLPSIAADETQIIQLFQNLISNSIKFRNDRAPEIHISAIKTHNAWQFSVRDNGIGIEPQYFERIFLVFQRLHTRREYAGNGIGLALCKKIVEHQGGTIWVESEPGQGCTFHFTLPTRNEPS